MSAVKQNYGKNVLIQFEDFANHNAYELLAKYRNTHLVFAFLRTQANNAYIFPSFGLGLVISGSIRVHDDMLLAGAVALAGQVSKEKYEKGMFLKQSRLGLPFVDVSRLFVAVSRRLRFNMSVCLW